MSFSFGGLASPVGGQTNAGPDLESIETEQLGFQALHGERKVRILPLPWPTDALPSKTSSLLCVASQRGLIAAASVDTLLIYETDAVRDAFAGEGSGDINDLKPKYQTTIPRISHLTFTSDEQALVISAESGGGLAVYDINQLANNFSPSIQIATNGVGARHLLPNPNKDAAHLLAVVLSDGKLLVADLKSQNLVSSTSGSVLRDNVSSASWSKMGKQIVAGLADGTAVQLDIQGNQKEQIPRPPNVDESLPVIAIYWLENLDFLLIHAPITAQAEQDSMLSADSIYHIAHRDKETKACSFHRFGVDPCPPFNEERLPAHHFIQRIRDWRPNLDDSLIIACSASPDVGAFTRSKVALSQESAITHAYTTTSFIDTRRAALPIGADGITDTFPIGVALDLSSKENVVKPIPNDETLDESLGPLPQYCILNQEGYLSAWWYIYNEGVRSNTPAPGLVAAGGSEAASQTSSSSARPAVASLSAQTTSSASDKPSFGQPSQSPTPAFGKPSFGQPSQASFTQAAASSTPAFGAPSTPGQASPFAVASSTGGSFGKPSFGTPSQIGTSTGISAFGQASGVGSAKASVWGGSGTTTGTFGQPSTTASPFASFAKSQDGQKPAASPFAAFAQHSQNEKPAGSPFAAYATKPSASPFAGFTQNNQGDKKLASSPFAGLGQTSQDDKKPAASPFAAFAQKTNASPFGSVSMQNEKLSPFAAAGKPSMPNETSFGSTVTLSSNNTSSFGSGATFGAPSSFGKPSIMKEEDMGDLETPREEKQESSALGGLSSFKLGSTFKPDTTNRDNDAPVSKDVKSSLFGFGFGDALGAAAKEKPTVVKEEAEESEGPALEDIPEHIPSAKADSAPMPPDFLISKPKEDSQAADAPLPPDFLKATPKNDAPLPPDFLSKATKSSSNQDAPLPPDFLPKPTKTETDTPLPPMPTADDDDSEEDADAEAENLDEAELLEDDDDSANWEEEDEDEADDEEDEEEENDDDNEEDLDDDDEEEHSPVIANPAKLSAFEARLTPASPKKSSAKEESTTPETVQRPTFTPAGFPKAPLNFVPTRKVEESPRSPSPVRAVTSPVRFDQRKAPAPAVKHDAVPSLQARASGMRSSAFQAPTQAQDEELEDEDDLRSQRILNAPIEPNRRLPDFIAYQDYNAKSQKEGVAGQLERVYRDVNSMIDTLGLNARALQGFVAGHERQRPDALREEDLDNADGWVLVELSGLDGLQTSISDKLDQGKITEVSEKLAEIAEQEDQVLRQQPKVNEIRKQINARNDPEQKAQQQAAPLPQAWATQQLELRQSLQQAQKLLTQVEDSIGVLRADFASASAASPDGSTNSMPTVEAVTNTILKMTSMIEKSSGDIDVLEAQMRRLPDGSASFGSSTNYEDSLASSLAGSRISMSNGAYSTPRKGAGRGNGEALGISGMFGPRFRTPPSASLRHSTVFDPAASVLGRSTSSLPGSARKKMSDVTNEDVEVWKTKTDKRRAVLSALRQAVEDVGDARVVRTTERP